MSRNQKLANALCLYQYKWDLWTSSQYCFLTEKEIAAIEIFHRNIFYQTKEPAVGISAESIIIYKRAIKKLLYYNKLYREWIFKNLQNKKYSPCQELREDDFLQVPLQSLHLTTKLYMGIAGFGNTIGEVLKSNNSRKQFLAFKGFGIKTLRELEKLLEKHKCLHLISD